MWLLIYLGLVIFAAAHGTVVYSKGLTEYAKAWSPADDNERFQKFQELTGLTRSLNAYWSAFLSDYSSLPERDSYLDFCKVVYALFITVVALNIMSMYCLSLYYFRSLIF